MLSPVSSSIRRLDGAAALTGLLSSAAAGALWERSAPAWSPDYFERLVASAGDFRHELKPDQVRARLGDFLQAFPGQETAWWLDDVEQLCRAFCAELGSSSCLVHLDKERPCRRFHADNLRLRLVCTYRGPGTQWLDSDNVHLERAETRGTVNRDIVLDPGRIRQCREWDVLVMKGKLAGGPALYHKSPDPRPGDPPSLLLKLDEPGLL